MNAHQQLNSQQNAQAMTRPIFNIQSRKVVGYAIPDRKSSANVPHSIYISAAVLDMFEGDERECFEFVRDLQRRRMMPRMGSEARPLKERDLELARRNVKLGERHWQWIQSQGWDVRQSTGYDYVHGFGFHTPDGFVIVDGNDKPVTVVRS